MSAERGFTLLETIVALLVVGLIVAGLAGGTRFGIAATNTTDRWAARDESAFTAERVLRALVVGAVATGGSDGRGPFAGGAHGLALTAFLASPLPGERVAEADVAVALRADGALVLSVRPHYPGATLRPGPPIELPLCERIARLDVTYRGRGDRGTEWRRSWTADGLPLLVRFHIVPRPGGRMPAWPDIVAGPFRMQMPS